MHPCYEGLTQKPRTHASSSSYPIFNPEPFHHPNYTLLSRPTEPQQGLTPKGRIILQQIVDIPHPIVLFAWANAFFSILRWLCDRRAVDAGYRIRRCTDGDRLSWFEGTGGLPIHGDTSFGSTAVSYLCIVRSVSRGLG